MSEEKPPDWLPDGWIMELRLGKKDRTYRYYICPESGDTFTSKEGVMRYLNGLDVNPAKGCKQTLHQKVIDVLNWMPSGWFMEIRVLNSASKAGQYYKCYINKSTGMIFYSKEDVLQFLSTGEDYNSTLNKESDNSETDYYVLVQIEYSPNDLPPGWIRETKFRNKINQKDLFFRDPASGYVFRSVKEVFRYVEDGVFSRHAYQPRTKSLHNLLALELECPGDVKNLKNIFLDQDEAKELPVLPSLDCKTSQISRDAITDIKPVGRWKKKKTFKQTLHALLKRVKDEEESGDTASPSNACDD